MKTAATTKTTARKSSKSATSSGKSAATRKKAELEVAVVKRGRGRMWTNVSALQTAMAAAGVEGPKAVMYLRHALGVSRSYAYELLRGSRTIGEQEVKSLSPLLGEDATQKLFSVARQRKIQQGARRRVLAEAQRILVEMQQNALARSIGKLIQNL